MLAGNSFINLAGSGEQINLCQQSPKMLKTSSESFIRALVLFLGLFLKISRCVPPCLSSVQFTCVFPGFPGPCSGVLQVVEHTDHNLVSLQPITHAFSLVGSCYGREREETRGRVGEDPGNEVASLTEKIYAISLSYHLK